MLRWGVDPPIMRKFSRSRMSGAKRCDADPDEESGVISVQTTLLHHGIRDIAGGLAAIESIADLMTGDDRGLPGREGDPLGAQCIQEVGVDGVGMRGWRGVRHGGERGEHQD
jgi:hypothetical protein